MADRDEHLQRVENMAKSVSSSRASTTDGKPKRDHRRTMLGRFRRPRASAAPNDAGAGDGVGGGVVSGGGETNVALANYITNKREKKVGYVM